MTFQGKGADYDESTPRDCNLYDINVIGLGGIDFLCEQVSSMTLDFVTRSMMQRITSGNIGMV